MVDNKQIQKINKILRQQIVQKFSVMAVALLVVGSVAYFGTHQNQSSHAAGVGTLSMSPASGTLTNGSNVNVTLFEDSGTDLVNSVQASVSYDPAKLQYVSLSEGTAFPNIAATSTGVAGQVRVGRGTLPGGQVSGSNAIVTLTFKVIGSSGTTALSYDPAFSFIVRSTDSVNILTATTGASYNVQLPAPTVTAVSPTSGTTAGGTQVTITGTNFVAGASVNVGGTPASNVLVTSPTTLTAIVPAHTYGTVNVTVTNPDGQSVTKTSGFTYVAPAPTVTTVTPASGPLVGGNTITVAGTNFLNGATVKVGGVAATGITFVSATSLTAVVPAHAAGSVDVVVTNPDGQAATKVGGFTYVAPAPTIGSVAPTSGTTAGGTKITITGTNFISSPSVTVGGTAATGVVFVSSTSLTAIVPAHSAGAVSVMVTNPDGQAVTKASAFTYVNPAPTITSISPTSGVVSGGVSVTITGNNFLNGASVSFGTTQAAGVTFVSSTTLIAITPVDTAGSENVIVTNPDGQVTGGVAPVFTYLSNPGDANNDGRVNAIDLSILISNDGLNYPPADFNGDGTVGSADLAILLGKWTW